jgi:two-component system LytT family response regulator
MSNYNALIASLQSNDLMKLGLQLTARYTYAVAKDNLSSTFSDSPGNTNLGLTDPFNPKYDYGHADFDVRHHLSLSYNWEIPLRVHSGNKSHLLRDTISGLESQLDPKKFLRIHRSAIVKIDKIKELQPWFHGEYHVILENGKQLTLSRNYRANLQEAVGKPL